MFDRNFIAYFKLAHGLFNATMLVLFLFQARLGLLIRKARLAAAPLPLPAVRRHRAAGPVLALWGVLGYLAGVILVLLDKGRFFEYPLHFATGTAVVLLIGWTFAVSRRIAGAAIPSRVLHFRLGAALLAMYVVQILIGLSILL
jgi:hypothetical protein